MVVKMDSYTPSSEEAEKRDTGPKGSEGINMRSRLRSRNTTTGNNITNESSASSNSTITGTSVRGKTSKKSNTSIGETNSTAATVRSSSPSSKASSKCDVTEESICNSGWPLILDFCKDECKRMLREYELCAYEQIVRVFRAQGNLTDEKRKFLHALQQMLSISIERHQGEVRRATFDETLVTIAKQLNSCQDESIIDTDVTSGWIEEGRRLISLLPRLVPQTAFHTLANHVAVNQVHRNNSLPLPCETGDASRLLDTSKISSISPKKSRIDSVSSTSLIVKNNASISNNSSSNNNSSKCPPNSQVKSQSKCSSKLPVTKVPSVAKAMVTSNSGITTTHLAVVRKSVNNLIRQNSSPCKAMLNHDECESSLESLVSNYSNSKGKNIEFNNTAHPNVGRVIFLPSSTSSSSSSSQIVQHSRLIKSSPTHKLISLPDTSINSCRYVNSSSSTSSPSISTVKVVPVSTVTSPLKKGHSITVVSTSSSTSPRTLNLISNNCRMTDASTLSNGILSSTSTSTTTSSTCNSLPGQGMIIQTYTRSTGGSSNGGKKANVIIVPSSKSLSSPLSTKASISVSNVTGPTPASSIIGKVMLPSTSPATGVKRPSLAHDVDTTVGKKARIVHTAKDTPKVITLQPTKASSLPMSGRMIDVPGLTAEAVESLIKGKVTPQIMKLVQSAVSASLAKDHGNKQQVITCNASNTCNVVTSHTNCITSTIAVSKMSPSTVKQSVMSITVKPTVNDSTAADDSLVGHRVNSKEITSAPEKPLSPLVQESSTGEKLPLVSRDEPATSTSVKQEHTQVDVEEDNKRATHSQVTDPPMMTVKDATVTMSEQVSHPKETAAQLDETKIDEECNLKKQMTAATTASDASVSLSNNIDQVKDCAETASDSLELSSTCKEDSKDDDAHMDSGTGECPRIQPIKLSRQGSSWVPFNSKSDDSDASHCDADDSDDPDEEAVSADAVEDEEEEDEEEDDDEEEEDEENTCQRVGDDNDKLDDRSTAASDSNIRLTAAAGKRAKGERRESHDTPQEDGKCNEHRLKR